MSKTPRKRAKSKRAKEPRQTNVATMEMKSRPRMISDVVPTIPPLRPEHELERDIKEQNAADYLSNEIAKGISTKDVQVKWPTDWFNALKERFAFFRVVSPSPVRYNTLTYTEMEWNVKGKPATYNIVTPATSLTKARAE